MRIGRDVYGDSVMRHPRPWRWKKVDGVTGVHRALMRQCRRTNARAFLPAALGFGSIVIGVCSYE